MKNNRLARRDFLKRCLASTAAIGGVSLVESCARLARIGISPRDGYDSKGLPIRALGKTGVSVPIVGFGSGSRFCRILEPEKSVEALNYALDHGLYHWDTAHDYVFESVNSEERLCLGL